MKCDARCRPAPYCGDKKVDTGFGEVCDDGVNSGLPGSCKTDCTATSRCPRAGTASCRPTSSVTPARRTAAGQHLRRPLPAHVRQRHPRHGRGLRRRREQRRLRHLQAQLPAGRLLRRRGQERPRTVRSGRWPTRRTPTAPNKCTTMCTTAPYCGDGRIQTGFGETCDSTPAVQRHLHEDPDRLIDQPRDPERVPRPREEAPAGKARLRLTRTAGPAPARTLLSRAGARENGCPPAQHGSVRPVQLAQPAQHGPVHAARTTRWIWLSCRCKTS